MYKQRFKLQDRDRKKKEFYELDKIERINYTLLIINMLLISFICTFK